MATDKNVIGLAMQLDVADLKAGIKEVNKIIKTSKDEFNNATAGLDKWSKSSEGLTAKLTQLNKQFQAQQKVVAGYEAEIKRVSELEGDHTEQLNDLQSKLLQAQTQVKKTEKEISKYSDTLVQVTKEEKESQSVLTQLTDKISEQETELSQLQKEYKNAVLTYGKNSKQAKALKNEIEDLSDELEENQKQVKYADRQLEQLDKQFDETEDGAESFAKGLDGIKNLGSTVAKGLATIGASVAGLATAFLATSEGTKEYRTNMGKLEAGFESAGLKAEQAKDLYKDLYSVVADEGKATEASAMIGQLAKNQEDLNKWVNISTGVYATFGDSLPIENLAEASLETAKTGKLTGGLADALNWAGISEEGFQKALDKCTTEQERQKLITDTLNKTYDEASKKYQQVNKDVIENNRSQVELTDTMAQFGEKAEPILTAIKDGFNEVMKAILGLLENVDFEAIETAIQNAFAYFIDTIIPAIIDGFKWIMENKDILITGIVAIGTAMLAWNVVSIIQGVVGAIKTWTTATQGLTVAQKALDLIMRANSIGIIITLISGLVAGFIHLWNTSDKFRQFWIDLWEKIKVSCSNAWENIKAVWGVVADWFGKVFNGIVNWFKGIPESISGFFSSAWSKVKEAWNGVTDFFGDIKDKIINSFKELPSKMLTVGEDLIKGLWNGIKDMTSWINDKLKDFGENVLNGIKDFFGIHSPSRVFRAIGQFLGKGLGLGIEDESDNVTKTAIEMGEKIVDGVSSVEKDMKDAGEKTGEAYAIGTMSSAEQIKDYFNSLADEIESPKITPEIETRSTWQKFIDECGCAVGISEDKIKTFTSNVEKYFTKLTTKFNAITDKISEYGNTIADLFNQVINQQTEQLDYELEKYQEQKDCECELAEEKYNTELEAQKEALVQGLISKQQYNANAERLERDLANTKKKLEAEKRQAEEETLKRKNELAKKQFYAQKVNDIAEATINGAQATLKGFAQLGPIGGAINAGVQAGITAAQIAIIAKQKFVPMLAKGGIIDNPTLAMIGEAGKEAVIPLENNTGWITELASKLNAVMMKDFSLARGFDYAPAYAGMNGTTNNFTQIINAPKTPSRIELYRDSKNLLALKR